METFKVEGWYRYGNNEKDFEFEIIEADTAEDAIKDFLEIYKGIRFFKLLIL